jgi:hypothetical protein
MEVQTSAIFDAMNSALRKKLETLDAVPKMVAPVDKPAEGVRNFLFHKNAPQLIKPEPLNDPHCPSTFEGNRFLTPIRLASFSWSETPLTVETAVRICLDQEDTDPVLRDWLSVKGVQLRVVGESTFVALDIGPKSPLMEVYNRISMGDWRERLKTRCAQYEVHDEELYALFSIDK